MHCPNYVRIIHDLESVNFPSLIALMIGRRTGVLCSLCASREQRREAGIESESELELEHDYVCNSLLALCRPVLSRELLLRLELPRAVVLLPQPYGHSPQIQLTSKSLSLILSVISPRSHDLDFFDTAGQLRGHGRIHRLLGQHQDERGSVRAL